MISHTVVKSASSTAIRERRNEYSSVSVAVLRVGQKAELN